MTTDTRPEQRWIERVEKERDLRSQIDGLGADEEQETQFMEWSPGRKLVTIWSMETGEQIEIPRYQAAAAIRSYKWTADPKLAPKQKVNSTKCFMHADSPERAILDELGISYKCPAAQLANKGSARVHAEHRHPSAWRQYQEYLSDIREEEYRQERREELEAFKAIAKSKP